MVGEKTKIFLVFGMFVILLLLASLLWTLLTRDKTVDEGQLVAGAGEAGEPVSTATFEESLADKANFPSLGPRERNILERHFQAVGGVDRIASINSVLVTGEIHYPQGAVQPIVLVKKSGQKLRLSIKTGDGQIVMAVTPENNWRALYQNGKLRYLDQPKEDEVRRLKRSAYVVSELYMALNNEWTVRYLGQLAFNYKMAHCFEVKLNEKDIVRFFINPDTFMDVGREDWYYDADGELTIARILGSEHIDIAGLKVPGRIENYEDNDLKQVFVATDVEINPGILDSSFLQPEIPPEAESTP